MKRLVALFSLAAASFAATGNWKDQGVIYLDHTPHAAMHPVPVHAVHLGAGFWSERRKVNVERSIPTMLDLLEAHGVLDNFRRQPHKGPVYTDSDLYKWIEAAAFALQSEDRPDLRAKVDAAIATILAAQEPSGYLNTYYVGEHLKQRFSEMHRSHELYNLGHLLQGAIAYYRATGDRKLLDGGIRYVNYLIENFGPDKRPLLTGHPELEMALIELYRTEGDRRYLDLAHYLLSGVETGRLHLRPDQTRYMFSGIPFTSRTEFVGHAVRAMYASSGATDYYAESGDEAYLKTLSTLWEDLTRRKMYITGGVGSRSEGEAFGLAYELPNAEAYTESCAAIGSFMWNFRMLAVTGESKYADVMERALYNGINSGVSLEGTLYCYRNPLASSGEKIRDEWYETTCCPPNIQRTLAALPGYMYATGKDGLYVNFYHSGDLDWHLEDGSPLRVTQQTEYPWKGRVTLTVTPARAQRFTLFVRVPAWSRQTGITAGGGKMAAPIPGAYFPITRTWNPGDTVQIDFDVQPEVVSANPRVAEDLGRIAVERGPLVYCLEQLDQKAPIQDLSLAPGSFREETRKDFLGGVVVLHHAGAAFSTPLSDEPLYVDAAATRSRKSKPAELTLIPYYAWANREMDAMEVWVPQL